MKHIASKHAALRSKIKGAVAYRSTRPSPSKRYRSFRKHNIGTLDRIFRAVLGSALIGSVFYLDQATANTFDYWVLLPLIGSYPALTAFLGWDPVLDVTETTSETSLEGDVCGSVQDQFKAAVGVTS